MNSVLLEVGSQGSHTSPLSKTLEDMELANTIPALKGNAFSCNP